MVYANAYGGVVLLAYIEKWNEALLKLLELFGILGIGIFNLLEHTGRVDIVARIDTHLLGIESRNVGYIGVEVYVCHKRSVEAVGTKLCVDVLKILGFASSLGRKAHQFAASLDDAFGLFHTRSGVVGVGSGHRLNTNRGVAAKLYGSYLNGRSSAAAIIK